MAMTFYKIRKKGEELYSAGGGSPRWSKRGKTWNNIGHVKNHLACQVESMRFGPSRNAADYADAELVTYEAKPVKAQDLNAFQASLLSERAKKEEAQRARLEADRKRREALVKQVQEAREKAELARLKKKYPEA